MQSYRFVSDNVLEYVLYIIAIVDLEFTRQDDSAELRGWSVPATDAHSLSPSSTLVNDYSEKFRAQQMVQNSTQKGRSRRTTIRPLFPSDQCMSPISRLTHMWICLIADRRYISR